MSRSVKEWIADHDDQAIPARVRLRVFRRFGGVCQITGRKIRPADEWDCDHIIALANGGEHREFNLQPALRAAHRGKTAQDVKAKAKSDAIAKRHFGITQPTRQIQSRGFSTPRLKYSRARGAWVDRETDEPVERAK